MSTGSKKILAVSLEGGGRAQATAAWDEGNATLVIIEIRNLAGDPHTWWNEMLRDIENKLQRDWVVLVEDRTASFPGNVINWNFDAVGSNGRTNLQSSLDWYFALDGRGAIVLPDEARHHALRMGGDNDILVCKQDEKGRLVYDIQWARFTPGHKAMLMCVAGAVMEKPLSERWMRVFLGTVKPAQKPPVWPVFRVMKELYETHWERHERRVEATEAQKHVQH